MIKKMIAALAATVFLMLSVSVSAETVSAVWYCELNDGKTQEDAQAVNAEWLKWAREVTGSDAIESSYINTLVGDLGGFMWVDSFPDFGTWARMMDADDNEDLDAAFNEVQTCSGNRLLQGEETVPAK